MYLEGEHDEDAWWMMPIPSLDRLGDVLDRWIAEDRAANEAIVRRVLMPGRAKVPAAPSAAAAPTLRAPVHAEIDGEGFVRTGPVPGRPLQMAMWGLKH